VPISGSGNARTNRNSVLRLVGKPSPPASRAPARPANANPIVQEVAEETDLQIIVATTHGPMLSTVLPQGSLLVATGTDFVW